MPEEQDDLAITGQLFTTNPPYFTNSQCIETIIVEFLDELGKAAGLMKCVDVPGAKSHNRFGRENRILLQASDPIAGLLQCGHLAGI